MTATKRKDSPTPADNLPTAETLRHALSTTGYIVLPSILTSTEISTLRAAAAETTRLARTSQWPHIRTVPKQFPPWPSTPPPSGIWGVQHLLHPSLPASPTLAASYFHPTILTSVMQILDCDPDELVMELYNLLVRPDEDFELRWHRDDIPPTATREEEEARLCGERRRVHAQWNLALWEDESLVVVPGSQGRARTDEERDAGEYEEVLEGMVKVRLRPGDVVFYDNNILHTGRYRSDKERATLHGSIGLKGADGERARNVLQHGVGTWVEDCDFGGLEGEWAGRRVGDVAEGMRRALVEMGTGEGVGWSQGGKDE